LAPAGFAVTPGYWNYVHDYSFCSPRVNTVVVLHDRLPSYIVHHRDQGWGRQREPDFRDIEQVSRHRIVRENDRPTDSVAPWVRHRIERGEPVRERIDERGRERVIEHAGRQPNLQGPNGRDRDRPAVSNDDWRHRGGNDDHGHQLDVDRNDDRGMTNHAFEHRNQNDDRDRRPEVIDVPRRPGHQDDGRRGGPPPVDDDRQLTRQPRVDVDRGDDDARNAGRPRVSDDGAWRRPQGNPGGHQMDRSPSPGVMYRGGGGGRADDHRAQPGAGMGGGRAAGPTMQHGGGGGAERRRQRGAAGGGARVRHEHGVGAAVPQRVAGGTGGARAALSSVAERSSAGAPSAARARAPVRDA
jgi:hypothetical protein